MVALTLSPALCRLLLKPGQGKKFFLFRWFDAVFGKITDGYVGGVAAGIKYVLVTVAIFGILCFATWRIQQRVPSGFLPDEDQGYILSAVLLPDGADRTGSLIAGAALMRFRAPDR